MKKILSLVMIFVFLFAPCKANGNSAVATSQNATPMESTGTEVAYDPVKSNPLDLLEITLPDGMERQRVSDTREDFHEGPDTVGGAFLLTCDDSIFENVLEYANSLTPLVIQAMEDMGMPEMEWYMGNSSVYGLHEFNMGNAQSEYIAYVVRGKTACYVLWFDRNQVPYDTETAIMKSLHSEDITDELNMISNEAYMAAISESMARGDYCFEIVLPEGIIQEETAVDGALFYRGTQLVGGYKVIHFEKGILPSVHDNQELVLKQLKEEVKDQIDLTDFSGEITDERLITAVFSNGSREYTHYILSYGQAGTQYDIWLDKALLDQQEVDSIIWGAQLVEK